MSKTIVPIVVDEGAGQAKTVFRIGEEVIAQITPSTVEDGSQYDNQAYSKHSFKLDNGKVYTVATNTHEPRLNTNPDRYQISDRNLAVVHNALVEAGFGGKDVVLAVTLPIGMFYSGDGAYNKELVLKKKANLKRGISAMNPDMTLANIVDVAVFPESMSAFETLVFNEKGEPRYKSSSKRYVTIDIGDSTTDIAIFYEDGQLEKCQSFRSGVSNCRKALKPLIMREYDFDAGYDVLKSVLKEKSFNGEDAGVIVQQAVSSVFEKHIDNIVDFIESPNAFARVFLIGGGASVFGDMYKADFGDNVVIPEDPEFTLARSMLKELEYMLAEGYIGSKGAVDA